MTGSISSAFVGRASKSRSIMRIATSGNITITSWDFPATAPSALPRAVRSAPASRMLGTVRPGAIAPSARWREVKTSRRDDFSDARAAITPSDVISQASRGRIVFCFKPAILLSRSLNEGDFVDFLHGGHAGSDPGQRGIAQELHAFFRSDVLFFASNLPSFYLVVSMKVTLLISFMVVTPALTRASAESRRNFMPSSDLTYCFLLQTCHPFIS